MKKIILLILLTFTCTGCWNYKELTELGVISAIGIDYKENKYVVNLQLINTLEGGDNGITEAPISVMSGSGDTIMEAVRSMNLKTSKVFFPSNTEYVILSETIITKHLNEVLDFLTRNTKLSLNFLIVTSLESEQTDILSSLSKFDLNSASNLSNMIKRSENLYGEGYYLNMKDLLKDYLSFGIRPVIPNIYLVKNDDEKNNNTDSLKESDTLSYPILDSLISFNDDKIIKLSEEESFGFNFINNNIKNALISTKCDDSYFSIETLKSKVSLEDKLKKDTINIKGSIEAELVFFGCDSDLDKNSTIEHSQKLIEEEIIKYIKSSVEYSQKTNVDYLGIGNFIYKNNKNYFDFKNDDWEKDGLPYLNFTYDIKVSLHKQGNLKGSI